MAGERLLTVADELQTRMTGNHLLAVPERSKRAKLVKREKKQSRARPITFIFERLTEDMHTSGVTQEECS